MKTARKGAAGPARPKVSELARVEIDSVEAWRAWLEANHGSPDSIWLVTWKKGDPRHVGVDDVVETALCYGWIDSRPSKLDAMRTMLLLSPRAVGSAWSRLNKTRADRMIAAGRMRPAGLRAIEAAKADGSWSKLDAVEDLVVPADLAQALDTLAEARGHWEGFPKSARRGILEWIEQSRFPKTRAARIRITADLASRNERANQWRGTPKST